MSVVVLSVAIALAASVLVFAGRRSDYRHSTHTISELGERGCPDASRVSLGVFLPVGLVLAAVSLLQRTSAPLPAALAGVIAVGYIGAAVFRCDHGSPLQGSSSQAIHNIAGGVQYVGGALVLSQLGARDGTIYYVLSAVVVLAAVFLSVPALHASRGLAQRAGEVALFVGLALALRT